MSGILNSIHCSFVENGLDSSPTNATGAPLSAYAMALVAAAAEKSQSVELFQVVTGLSRLGQLNDGDEHLVTLCNQFALYFAPIYSNLGSAIEVHNLYVQVCLTMELWDTFQSVQPEDVDKILGEVRPTTCTLDPYPFLADKSCQE